MSNTPRDRAADTAVVAAFTTDVGGGVNSWSREAEKIFGRSAEGVMGKSLQILFPEESSEAEVRPMAPTAGDDPRKWFRRLDGSRFEARHVAVRLSNVSGAIGHAH